MRLTRDSERPERSKKGEKKDKKIVNGIIVSSAAALFASQAPACSLITDFDIDRINNEDAGTDNQDASNGETDSDTNTDVNDGGSSDTDSDTDSEIDTETESETESATEAECEGVFEEEVTNENFYLTQPKEVGGYDFEYMGEDAEGVHIKITCASDSNEISTETFEVGVERTIEMEQDGKNIIITVTTVNEFRARCDLAVEEI